jgi:phosphotriesterase-related protein
MTASLPTGKVQTVLGQIDPAALGITMPHEHLFIDTRCMFDPPTEGSDRRRAYAPFDLENLGWIRLHYFRHYDNLLLVDEQATIAELIHFKVAGGSTIVDVSTPGIGRDPVGLARAARASGVNVVMATGFYVASTHPAEVARMTEQDIVERMISEIRDGATLFPASAGDQDWQPVPMRTGVRAGIIKVAVSYPLHQEERKVLRAAAVAQRATGAAITVHVGRHELSAREILDTLAEADADLTRASMDHLDLRVEKMETLVDIAQSGCFLEFDLFGHESSYYPLTARDMPSDAQRLDVIGSLIDQGFLSQILISQDICTKHRLVAYGGHGYGYIPEHIVLRMRDRSWDESTIETIVIENPARLLTFADPQNGSTPG